MAPEVRGSGLPIEVISTYDSRDKSAGDFGPGWNVSLRNIRVEPSGTLGKAWRQDRKPGFWPVYCVAQARPRFVTVTFPTGKVKYASESETGKRAEDEHATEGSF